MDFHFNTLHGCICQTGRGSCGHVTDEKMTGKTHHRVVPPPFVWNVSKGSAVGFAWRSKLLAELQTALLQPTPADYHSEA